MKTATKFLFLGFLALFCFPSNSRGPQEREKIIITDSVKSNPAAAILQINTLPKFTFSLNGTFRIRKTEGAIMYEYKPKKPGKPYRHLMLFLELLQKETEAKLPKIDVVVVTTRELLDIMEVNGITWVEPLTDTSAKQKGSGLLWFAEEDTFWVFIANFKDPTRALLLEQFLAHLSLLAEWELSVRNVSPEDTEVLVDKRGEEWRKREGKAFLLFHRISGNWHLLQLNWPPVPSQRLKILSVPLPWPFPRNKQ